MTIAKANPLTVSCAVCGWMLTGRTAPMLAAQRKHRKLHTETKGRPR